MFLVGETNGWEQMHVNQAKMKTQGPSSSLILQEYIHRTRVCGKKNRYVCMLWMCLP